MLVNSAAPQIYATFSELHASLEALAETIFVVRCCVEFIN